MQFTKLRLLGFKSFVDPTELVIAPGLTGVVGPNGCGKSNLLEALRWVMGENRPSAMRGDGMEDVIFAGAASRPARNHAEVTLTIDNLDRLAPAAFNTADMIEVVRRITRDAGSAYKANGKEARARDVQMLFADASTGAHSPSLVRQGQIAELISARPKARRRILEEAAGISGLYQRRHEAELKLNGTETNLARVQDVLEALDQQLKSLARQARQAARYREIAEALRKAEGMVLFRRWQEAERERMAAAERLTDAGNAAARARAQAVQAARAREQAEDAVPPLREEDAIAGAVLARLRQERESLAEAAARAQRSIEGLTGQTAQLLRDQEREAGLQRDAGETIDRLKWEREALDKAAAGHDARLEAARAAASDAAAALQDEEAAVDRLTEDAARLAARRQAAERRLSEAGQRQQKADDAVGKAEAEVADLTGQVAAAADRQRQAEAALDLAKAAAARAETTLESAERDRADAQSGEAEFRAARAAAEAETAALRAETMALQRLLAREQGTGGRLLDHVRAAPGFEAALGAALGDDLRAPELPDAATGDHERIPGNTPATQPGGSGWASLPDTQVPALPPGARPLAAQVRAPLVLARRLAATGVVDAQTGARLHGALLPGQRLVSQAGDLWRWDGYRVAAGDAPSAAALLLQQKNRFDELTAALQEAEAASSAAQQAHEQARARLDSARATEAEARNQRKAADEAATGAVRQVSRTEADLGLLNGRLEALSTALASLRAEAAEADAALGEARAGLGNTQDLDSARARLEARRASVEAARAEMLAKRSVADDLRREGEARTRRLREIATEAQTWTTRQANADQRLADLAARIAAAEAELATTRAAPAEIAAKGESMAAALLDAEKRRQRAADALALGETARRDAEAAERAAERAASDAREARARAEATAEAMAAGVETAAQRIHDETGEGPQALLGSLDIDPASMPPIADLDGQIAQLRRQREGLGAVNLRAEEDSREVQSEFDTLSAEKADLEAAVAKLRHGISGLNREGRERLLAAFEEVNRNFCTLFTTLFGGGEANLVLVESDDPLDAGLEILCQPPGKKLSTLSLLSGGEQTLTALSLIFAVFLANPSPICVLDEVDAPLDDANVTRFCDLLDEMTGKTRTRFLIITHHAVTMARMDRLFGVTMAEQGVSQLVSVDLRQAEELIEG